MIATTMDFASIETLREVAGKQFGVPAPTDNDLERALAWAQVAAARANGSVEVGWPGERCGTLGAVVDATLNSTWWCRLHVQRASGSYIDIGPFFTIEPTLERALLVAFVAASEYAARTRKPVKTDP